MAFYFLRTIDKQEYLYERVNNKGKRKDKLLGNVAKLRRAIVEVDQKTREKKKTSK